MQDRRLTMQLGNRVGWTSWMVASALAGLVSACGGGGGGGVPRVPVSGTVLMPWGEPVVGATVGVEGDSEGAVTGDDGSFVVLAPQGDHTLVASLDGVALTKVDVSLTDRAGMVVGDLDADVSIDDDADGVPDAIEVVGWTIYVDLTGRGELTERRVRSDPRKADTDGDGLSDAVELASLTDPRRADTDGDGLDDREELEVYKSNPCDVDTDHDSRGPSGTFLPNPALFDGNEVRLSRTSPTLSDTDGDGLTDYEEIIGGGLAPIVADLPQLAISLNGDPSIRIIKDTTVTTGVESTDMTLVQDTSKRTQTDAQSMHDTFSNETQITASAKVGGPPLAVGASVEATNTTKNVFALDWSSSTSRESVSENTASYQQLKTSSYVSSASGGEFKAAFKVRNASKRSLLVKDLSIAAYRLTPWTPTGFTIIDILGPKPVTQGNETSTPFPEVVLAPDGEFTFVTQSRVLPLDQIEELITKPSSLFFEVANYALFQVDEQGEKVRDYAATGERVLERCGAVTIDFGNGEVDRFLVATNVRRNPDGSSAGLPMSEALEMLGFPYATTEFKVDGKGTGIAVLSSITDKQGRVVTAFGSKVNDFASPSKTVPPVGFWLVLATDRAAATVTRDGFTDGSQQPLALPRPLSEIMLKNGERVSLVFVKDSDGDGLFDGEEALLGTDPLRWDTDHDGVSDGYEVKFRRPIRFDRVNGYAGEADYSSTSDPLLADTDGDGLSDLEEIARGTDARLADTDGDGTDDGSDPAPLDPPSSQALPTTGLVAWYPLDRLPSASPPRFFGDDSLQLPALALAKQGGGSPDTQDIVMTGPINGSNSFPDRFDILKRSIYLQQESSSPSAYWSGPDLVLPADGRLTLAVWIRRSHQSNSAGLLCFSDSTGLVCDGDIVRFRTRLDGAQTFTKLGGDTDIKAVSDQWVFVVATLSPAALGTTGCTLKLYQNDGVLMTTKTLSSLPATAGKIVVGADKTSPEWNACWNGALDDVRIYHRALTPSEVSSLYHERNFASAGH